MYIGRFVIVGRTVSGTLYLGYRVSSRSFPNRYVKLAEDRAAVLPTAEAAKSDNPYISYNCFRQFGKIGVVGNGSQVDPIIDKIALGYPPRDSLVASLLALDYERDAYNTPRVAAALDADKADAYLAFVGTSKLYSRQVEIAPGEAMLAATYECTEPTVIKLSGDSAQELADAIFNCEYELPVAVMAAAWRGGRWQMAARDAR